jgi:peroxiredoxin
MTQLVELQAQIQEFDAAGIRVYGISYDPPEALKSFSDRYGITYDLLSDVGSVVIRRFGILNTLVDPEDPRSNKFYGIPFPGTYVADESGVVTEKFFSRHYATRESAGTILDKAMGKVLLHAESPQANQQEERVRITSFLSDADLKLEVVSTLHVRLELAEGFHVYADPLPDGFYPTEIYVQPAPGLRIGEPVYPPTKPKKFETLGVTLNVYEGLVEIAVPITGTTELWDSSESIRMAGKQPVELNIVVDYQVCSETICYRPQTAQLRVEAPVAALIEAGS